MLDRFHKKWEILNKKPGSLHMVSHYIRDCWALNQIDSDREWWEWMNWYMLTYANICLHLKNEFNQDQNVYGVIF